MKTFFKKINRDSKKIQTSTGFTIVETLVAIFVLLITTTGPLAFAQNGLRASFLARDQVTAFHLAQESVEIFKNIRDSNQVERELDWLENFYNCKPTLANPTVSCNMGKFQNTIYPQQCSALGGGIGKCSALEYDPVNKRFLVSGNGFPDSKYTRTVYVTLVDPSEIQVVVDVSWETQFLTPKNIVIQENIYKKY